VGRLIRLFPALGQVGLDREDAGRHPGADLVTDEPVVDEAQGGVGLEVQGQMRVEVGRIVPAHSEKTPAPGLCPARGQDRFGRQHGAGGETGLQQVAARQPPRKLRIASVHGPLLVGGVVVGMVLRDTPNRVTARVAGERFDGAVLKNGPAMLVIAGYTCHSWELLGMWAWTPAFMAACFIATGTGSLCYQDGRRPAPRTGAVPRTTPLSVRPHGRRIRIRCHRPRGGRPVYRRRTANSRTFPALRPGARVPATRGPGGGGRAAFLHASSG
jgi:hypothetical protein